MCQQQRWTILINVFTHVNQKDYNNNSVMNGFIVAKHDFDKDIFSIIIHSSLHILLFLTFVKFAIGRATPRLSFNKLAMVLEKDIMLFSLFNSVFLLFQHICFHNCYKILWTIVTTYDCHKFLMNLLKFLAFETYRKRVWKGSLFNTTNLMIAWWLTNLGLCVCVFLLSLTNFYCQFKESYFSKNFSSPKRGQSVMQLFNNFN
jgi:hypothetical protein